MMYDKTTGMRFSVVATNEHSVAIVDEYGNTRIVNRIMLEDDIATGDVVEES